MKALVEQPQERESITQRTGRISRKALAKVLGVGTRTIDAWMRRGVAGQRLPFHYIGSRLWFEWSEFYQWQLDVERAKRGGDRPAPRAKRQASAPEAKEALEKNGYT